MAAGTTSAKGDDLWNPLWRKRSRGSHPVASAQVPDPLSCHHLPPASSLVRFIARAHGATYRGHPLLGPASIPCAGVSGRVHDTCSLACTGRAQRCCTSSSSAPSWPSRPHSLLTRIRISEAHLSTKCPPSFEEARLPPAHVEPSRPIHRAWPPSPWKAEAVGLIGRLHGRRRFAELQRRGHRTRSGALRVAFRARDDGLPCVAFSIPRARGPAVERNRARRRLRAQLQAIAQHEPELLAPGDYLIAVHDVHFTSDEAAQWLKSALQDHLTRTS